MAKTVYQCEYCGMLHTKKEFAEKCEKSHVIVNKVKEYVYELGDKPKYPTEIKCEMSDGKTMIFYRKLTGIR